MPIKVSVRLIRVFEKCFLTDVFHKVGDADGGNDFSNTL